MEVTAVLLGKESVTDFEKTLTNVRKKMWKTNLLSFRQLISTQPREAATVFDNPQEDKVVIVYSIGKAVLASRSLPDIMTHSKLWTSSKVASRQVIGHRWDSSTSCYWYLKDEVSSFGLFVYSGQLEPLYHESLRNHTLYLLNKWISGPSDSLQLNLTLNSFLKFIEALKVSSFDDALVHHRLVLA